MKPVFKFGLPFVTVSLICGAVFFVQNKSSLPNCSPSSWYSKAEITADEREVLTAYFAKKKLLPISFFDARKADSKLMSVGVHECKNVGSSNGSYAGFIPNNATEGFVIGVKHKSDQFGSMNYMQMARIDGKLVVIGGGTSL